MKFSGVWNVFLYFIGQCKSAYGVYFQGGDMISGKGAFSETPSLTLQSSCSDAIA